MAVWLVRAGERGQDQDFALENNMVVIGWEDMGDLSQYETRKSLDEACHRIYNNVNPNTIPIWVGQLWTFVHRIQVGDLVALPLKGQSAIAFGRISGEYKYEPNNPSDAKHSRPVRWIIPDLPRNRVDQDIRYSLGALLTVCQIQRNNAEARIKALLEGTQPPTPPRGEDDANDLVIEIPQDLEEHARNQILDYIGQKLRGHDMADLVDAILQAQGYQTHISPPGPDGGVDIIAGRGPMGFDSPRLCVQVKSGDQQQDVRLLRELRGTMQNFNAQHGLFVSWGGFKRSVIIEARRQFFEIRLWDADTVVDAVLRYYDQFPEDFKVKLPLKHIWTLVRENE